MTDVPGFTSETFSYERNSRQVFRRGNGPAVVIMHEVPGITPPVAAFATRVADAGFSVYMPLLLGTPMRPVSGGYIAGSLWRACISREFRLLSVNQSSPIVDWLRALARHAHAEQGGPGVGAIGMCLTGNFALAMMLDSPMLAPVLSQPSLPFPIGKAAKSSLHTSDAELKAAHEKIDKHGARILGLRFHEDPACPPERFERPAQRIRAGVRGDRDRSKICQSRRTPAGAQRCHQSSDRRRRGADPRSPRPRPVVL